MESSGQKITTVYSVDKAIAREKATQFASQILLKIRKKRNLSQAELAEISGRKQSYISRVESGQQNISIATLQEIVQSAEGHLQIDVEFQD